MGAVVFVVVLAISLIGRLAELAAPRELAALEELAELEACFLAPAFLGLLLSPLPRLSFDCRD